MDAICDDLEAETDALGEVIAGISEQQWRVPTPAQGWDTRDTVIHLGMADWAATAAVADPERFEEICAAVVQGRTDLHAAAGFDFDAMPSQQMWPWMCAQRSAMIAELRRLDPKDRVLWFGPSMGAMSFVSARLMETWSHGHDVADAHRAELPVTDRLCHVARMGVNTRAWSYANRGLEVPDGPVRVELNAPSGAVWTWGPVDAGDCVSGEAYDFCLTVTQRRHHTETGLVIEGPLALQWMGIAQAFAWPPTDTERRRIP